MCYIVNDFSDQEFAALGKLVWSFTVLEHELAHAAMKLRHDTALASNSTEPIDVEIKRAVNGSLQGRFNEFIKALELVNLDEQNTQWVHKVKCKFPDVVAWRNRACHGNWRRLDDGQLAVRFVDRVSFKNEVEVDYIPLSPSDNSELIATNLRLAVDVSIIAGTTQ